MSRRTPLAALALAAGLAAVACSSTTAASPTITPSPPPARAATCAWYTPLAQPGQVVNVTATGPACRDRSLIDRLTADTDRPWTSEGVIPGSFGTPLATLARNGTTVVIWFTGKPIERVSPPAASPRATLSAPPAATLAGQLADALQAAGWRPVT